MGVRTKYFSNVLVVPCVDKGKFTCGSVVELLRNVSNHFLRFGRSLVGGDPGLDLGSL